MELRSGTFGYRSVKQVDRVGVCLIRADPRLGGRCLKSETKVTPEFCCLRIHDSPFAKYPRLTNSFRW
jgi:hypothetical protein